MDSTAAFRALHKPIYILGGRSNGGGRGPQIAISKFQNLRCF